MITTHADVVGSLLRPTELLEARNDLAAGRIAPAAFKLIEDRAVDAAVAIQEEAGLPIVSDGEMRRLSFQSQLPEAVDGFGEWDLDAFLWGEWHGDERLADWKRPRPENLGVVGKLRRRRFLCVEEFTYLRARTRRVPKVTIPSPGLFSNFWSPVRSKGAYPTLESFLTDVVALLREEVLELARLGATYIQIDAPHYPLLVHPTWREFYEGRGWPVDRWLAAGVEMDNALMDGVDGVTFGLHLCRGNQGSRWLTEGDYNAIASTVFRRTHAHRLLLEYDDARSGTFAPLADVPQDKMVVLGLITTKHARLENLEEVVGRIQTAARFFPLERLGISPQCGFATSIVGNNLSAFDQRQKLGLVVEAASRVWGQTLSAEC